MEFLAQQSDRKKKIKGMKIGALADVAEWIKWHPVNKSVAGSFPRQGTYLGCGPDPHLGVCNRQPHLDVSFSLFLPPLSKSK